MKNRYLFLCIFSIVTLSLSALDFSPIVARANVGIGYTFIDLPAALEWDQEYFNDWSQFNFKVNAQALFLHISPFSIGLEFGYNMLYYYDVDVPYVPSNLPYEGTVSTLDLLALGSYPFSDAMSVLAGLGIHIFDNGVVFGLKGSFVYKFRINKNMAIPLSAVCDVIFGDGIPIVIGATAGFEYSLDLK
jgi:hypothetical protein